MRVLIVDDEAPARRRLAVMLDELDVEVVGEAAGGLEALEMIRERRPDVVLLDIAMPEVDGLDVARHVEPPRPVVIFQTAFDTYALSAFEVEAADYVLKPVTLDRLRQALDRAERRMASGASSGLTTAAIERLHAAIAAANPARRPRLLVRDRSGHRLLALRDVLRCHAEDDVVHVYATSGRFTSEFTLAELAARSGGVLLRPSRADLVNADHVTRLTSNGDGSATLTLADGTTVHVTRRRAAEIRAALEG